MSRDMSYDRSDIDHYREERIRTTERMANVFGGIDNEEDPTLYRAKEAMLKDRPNTGRSSIFSRTSSSSRLETELEPAEYKLALAAKREKYVQDNILHYSSPRASPRPFKDFNGMKSPSLSRSSKMFDTHSDQIHFTQNTREDNDDLAADIDYEPHFRKVINKYKLSEEINPPQNELSKLSRVISNEREIKDRSIDEEQLNALNKENLLIRRDLETLKIQNGELQLQITELKRVRLQDKAQFNEEIQHLQRQHTNDFSAKDTEIQSLSRRIHILEKAFQDKSMKEATPLIQRSRLPLKTNFMDNTNLQNQYRIPSPTRDISRSPSPTKINNTIQLALHDIKENKAKIIPETFERPLTDSNDLDKDSTDYYLSTEPPHLSDFEKSSLWN